MSSERLQKFLARAGVAARRKAEELIREGRVTVNGRVASIGDKVDPEQDSVKVDERRIHAVREHRYLVLNKPKGHLTTVDDPAGRPTVIDLVPQQMRRALVPVGRLDFMTEGLLLLTDDGDFAQRVAHPRYGCRKIYEVKVSGVPPAEQIARLRRGILIDGRRTSPSHIRRLGTTARGADEGNSWWEVELTEGRSRQIREMFFRIEHPVQKLRRVAIGPLVDERLPLGAWRELTEEEVAALRAGGGRPPARSSPVGTRPRPAEEGARRRVAGRTRRRAGEGARRPKATREREERPAAGAAPAGGRSRPAATKRSRREGDADTKSRASGARPPRRARGEGPTVVAAGRGPHARKGAGKGSKEGAAGFGPRARPGAARAAKGEGRARPGTRGGRPGGRGSVGGGDRRSGRGGRASGSRRPRAR